MNKNLILGVLGIAILIGIGLVIKSNNKIVVQENIQDLPTEKPDGGTSFGSVVTIQLNDKFTFTDGLVVILSNIDDSRCPKDVQCIWAGELAITLELSGGISKPGEIHLGTVNNKSVSVLGYTFNLKDATENSATIMVVKN